MDPYNTAVYSVGLEAIALAHKENRHIQGPGGSCRATGCPSGKKPGVPGKRVGISDFCNPCALAAIATCSRKTSSSGPSGPISAAAPLKPDDVEGDAIFDGFTARTPARTAATRRTPNAPARAPPRSVFDAITSAEKTKPSPPKSKSKPSPKAGDSDDDFWTRR